jgi:hypothetical protein
LIAKSNKIPIRYVQDSVYKLYDDDRFYNIVTDVYEQNPLNTGSLTPAEQAKRQYFLQILSQMHN